MVTALRSIRTLFILPVLLLVAGCGVKNDIPVPENPETTGLLAPISLRPDSTLVVLSDYFLHPLSIDSILMDRSLGYVMSRDSLGITIYAKDRRPVPRISELKIWIDGFAYSILLERSRKIWYRFSFNPGEKKYRQVSLAGEMNDWVPAKTPLKEKDGIWQADLLLYPGKYRYKLVVDGSWILDPENPEKEDNNIGGFNSVFRVGSLNPPGVPIIYTKKSGKNRITFGVRNRVGEVFLFWQNHRLDTTFWKFDSTGLAVTIPRSSRNMDRSFIRIRTVNSAGSSNELLVPLKKGRVILDATELTRSDKEAMIIYFLMVDRFCNGNPGNDHPVKDTAVNPKLNFMGGDIAGITKMTGDGYFEKLGVNVIWISPITQNPPDAWAEYPPPHRKFSGYHGYWPITLSTIDTRFGTPEELKELVEKSHSRNMSVLLDYVSNHVHQDSWLYRQHPDWATSLLLPGNRKNLRLWDEQRLTTWFDEFLPTIDLSKPEVYEMISDSAVFWIREYGIDGFRHDATKHIPEVFWRTLTRKVISQVVIPQKRSVYQIGETYGSRELISSYINPGMLDGQFDFDIYFTGRSVFGRDNSSFRDLNEALRQSFLFYGDHPLMGHITGNQDQARFISLASGAIGPGEDDREAGWKRNIGVKDTIGYDRLASFIAFNMTIPGIPVIYYGDEFGMPGANDPDNRRMMRFDSLAPQEHRLLQVTQKLVHFRASSMPLLYGDFRTLEVSDDIFVYIRCYFDQYVVVAFNKSRIPKKIEFPVPDRFSGVVPESLFGTAFTMDKSRITLTLKGSSCELLYSKMK
jgi:glycosidase